MFMVDGVRINFEDYKDFIDYDYLYALDPDQEEIDQLNQMLGLPEDLISDGLSHTESRRIFRTEKGHVVIYLFAPVKKDEFSYGIEPVIMISSYDESVFIAKNHAPFLEGIARHALLKNISAHSINQIVDKYLDVLGHISLEIQALVENIKKRPRESDLLSVFSLQVSITQIDSAIDSLQLILEQGVEKKLFLSENEVSEASLQLKHAARTVDTYLAILQSSIDLIEGIINNRLNDIMKFLTAMTVVLSIPMIIAGFWGMNVPVPLTGSPHGFSIILWFSLIISVIATWYLIKKQYF